MSFLVANLDPHIHPLERCHRQILAKAGAELIESECVTDEEIIGFARDADAVLTASANITGRVIENLPNCKVIGRFGAGTDNVDHEAATRHGVVVVYVPDFCSGEVANHALLFVLACSRQLLARDREVRGGLWSSNRDVLFENIAGQTLGLVGFGRIGQCLAGKATALGMNVLAHDPGVSEAVFIERGVERSGFEELMQKSDYVSLHVPLTCDTTGLIGSVQLGMMKRSAYLINCARGAVVDEGALVEALRQGVIAGAALDCLACEPPPSGSALFGMDNVILTPHIAANSRTGIAYLREKTVLQVADVLKGRTPEFVRNPEVLGTSQTIKRM